MGWRIRQILAPTDFSDTASEAVRRAAALAREHNATLTILHVIDINPPEARTHCGTAEELMRRLRVTGVSQLCRLAEFLAGNQTQTQTRIVEGLPAEAIVENSAGFDLVVLGDRRAKSAWNLFSRHTVRHVIEQVECPVLVVGQETVVVSGDLTPRALAAV